MRWVVDGRRSTSERESENPGVAEGSLEVAIQPSISPIPRGKGVIDGTEPGVGRDARRLGTRERQPGDTEYRNRAAR